MQSGESSSDLAIQRAQQVELGAFIRANHRPTVPALITGDFNCDGRVSHSDGTPDRRYITLLSNLNLGPALTNLYLQNTGGLIPVTYVDALKTGSNLLEPDQAWNTSQGQGLDYAFFLPENQSAWHASSARPSDAITTTVFPVGGAHVDSMQVSGEAFTTLSDHMALTVSLQCSGSAGE